MKDFDFMAIVKAEVELQLKDAVKKQIAYACSSLINENPIRDLIRNGAAAKVRQAIEDVLK